MPNFFDCLLLYEELPSELMSTSTLESTSCLMGPCKGLTDCDVDRGQDDQVTPFRPVVLEGGLQGASKWMRAIHVCNRIPIKGKQIVGAYNVIGKNTILIAMHQHNNGFVPPFGSCRRACNEPNLPLHKRW